MFEGLKVIPSWMIRFLLTLTIRLYFSSKIEYVKFRGRRNEKKVIFSFIWSITLRSNEKVAGLIPIALPPLLAPNGLKCPQALISPPPSLFNVYNLGHDLLT